MTDTPRTDAKRWRDGSSTNYIANLEVNPTWVAFANGRTVRIVNGALEVGWLRDIGDESIAGEVLWRFKMALLGENNKSIDKLERELKQAQAQIEALQAELHNVKAVEFPARVDKVCEDWRKRAEKAEAQIETLRQLDG